MYEGGNGSVSAQSDSASTFSHLVALQPAGISQDEQELQLLHAGVELGVGGDAVGVEVGAVDVADDVEVVGELEVA